MSRARRLHLCRRRNRCPRSRRLLHLRGVPEHRHHHSRLWSRPSLGQDRRPTLPGHCPSDRHRHRGTRWTGCLRPLLHHSRCRWCHSALQHPQRRWRLCHRSHRRWWSTRRGVCSSLQRYRNPRAHRHRCPGSTSPVRNLHPPHRRSCCPHHRRLLLPLGRWTGPCPHSHRRFR